MPCLCSSSWMYRCGRNIARSYFWHPAISPALAEVAIERLLAKVQLCQWQRTPIARRYGDARSAAALGRAVRCPPPALGGATRRRRVRHVQPRRLRAAGGRWITPLGGAARSAAVLVVIDVARQATAKQRPQRDGASLSSTASAGTPRRVAMASAPSAASPTTSTSSAADG